MKTFRQELKTISGQFIQSDVGQSLHPVYVFWTWLRFRLKVAFILVVTHLIAVGIGVLIG